MRERAKRERKKEHSNLLSPIPGVRLSKFIEPIVKVHLLDKGYAYIPKMRDFTKDIKEESSRNQRFWAREASYMCYYASRDRDSSYFGLFPTLGLF